MSKPIGATPRWVDPPSGWRFGFPRIYDPLKYGTMEDFLIHHGYPEDGVDFALKHMRVWEVEKDVESD